MAIPPNPTAFPTPISSTCKLLLGDGSGYAIQASCLGAPPTTAATFQHGCIMIQTDTATSSQALYQNIGSVAVPSWSLLDTASASFTLPAAAIDATTTSGTSFGLTQNAVTSGVGIATALNALTTGQGLKIASSATAITTTGRLFLSSHSGATGTSATLNEFASAANDETIIMQVTASAANALGTAFNVSSATTTGNGAVITTNSLTTGLALSVASSATAMTSVGRLLSVVHSGATGVSTIIAEVSSAANDETVVMQVKASAALALGKVLNLSAVAVTTGTVLSAVDADALTTGTIANFTSNSSDVTARKLVQIVNDNTAAVGAVPLYLQQDAVGTAHFKTLILLGTIGIYVSDETSPNTSLTAAKGSVCLNGSATGQTFWNTDGSTAWTAFA